MGGGRTHTRLALPLPCSTGTFPATVVSVSTASSGEPQANKSARASSIPGSVSMTAGITGEPRGVVEASQGHYRRVKYPKLRRKEGYPVDIEILYCGE